LISRRAEGEESVRAVLLTGAGRAFLAGQDLVVVDEIRAGGSFSRNLAETWNAIVRSLWNLEKPVVAAVNGPAVGAAFAVALACDLVAGDIARRLATGPTAAFGAAKRVMHRGIHLCLDEALALEGAVQDVVAATEDAHEGVAAFLAKRPPKFQGR
jgi:enoyl-CoA hydratase/carnithine racemase